MLRYIPEDFPPMLSTYKTMPPEEFLSTPLVYTRDHTTNSSGMIRPLPNFAPNETLTIGLVHPNPFGYLEFCTMSIKEALPLHLGYHFLIAKEKRGASTDLVDELSYHESIHPPTYPIVHVSSNC
jgi:hypothetical protein